MNKGSVFRAIGASNHTASEREKHDFYATHPKAGELLLTVEKFSPLIWEPACGQGHLSTVFEKAGHTVLSTDLVYRGYGSCESLDFLKYKGKPFDGDIITNPPYMLAMEFVKKAIETVSDGHKIAMFLKLQFLDNMK